ncbi:hypothetical protein ASD88_25875 [Pelomonas sp. Root662]|uniref:STAS/SEC14 domain-containing protein n=1 Tax=Pelomonas sp. Root405 TaxID=1736529 RepID=UPI0006F3D5E8|nr:STAS/SEC14 domain-containing protein [Pelomonas sp. Root405]KQW49553.1 hypothetical protein ASC81_25890 [Pelomonas sp. Root405]KRA75611.1 hypothetical protein ASD88_25875 [Pelomonas sp. Root662]
MGKLVIARIRGDATEEVLRECQSRVLAIVADSRLRCVLYDLLEARALTPEVALSQIRLDEAGPGADLRRAIVVPNSHLAYVARLAFGTSDHRVFYSDIAAAFRWLDEPESPCADESVAVRDRQQSSQRAH